MEAVEDGGMIGDAKVCEEIGDVGLRRLTRFTEATFPFCCCCCCEGVDELTTGGGEK